MPMRMGVAHLGDRLDRRPADPGRLAEGPAHARQGPARRSCSSGWRRLGFYEGTTDGKFGSKTRDAVRNFQLQRGLIPDGYADYAVLRELRAAR